MTAAQLARALGGRRSGEGHVAKCPAHEDNNPSLSIASGDGGKLLIHCHAGCSHLAVIDAIKALGLWPEGFRQNASKCEGGASQKIVATYDYTDEHAQLLYQVCRTDPKGFFQRRPDSHGQWINRGPKDADRVLYRLREVLEAPIVFICEGEKDVETLRDYGFIATTNAGGANAPWLDSYTDVLRGRECIIVPDNDSPGWKRALFITKSLFGVAARTRVFDLPRNIKDISEWFAAGHSEFELITMLEGVHGV